MARRLLASPLAWLAIAVLAASLPLAADSMSFSFASSNLNYALVPPPYGTVTLTLNASNGIDFDIEMGTVPSGIYAGEQYTISGGGEAFAFNGGTSLTASNFSDAAFSLETSSGALGPWGKFDWALDGPAASAGVTSLTFTIAQPGGFTSVSDLVGLSDNDSTDFAAHVLCQTCGNGITGFAGTTAGAPPPEVPEPASLLLLGTALLGLVGLTRRRAWGASR